MGSSGNSSNRPHTGRGGVFCAAWQLVAAALASRASHLARVVSFVEQRRSKAKAQRRFGRGNVFMNMLPRFPLFFTLELMEKRTNENTETTESLLALFVIFF